MTYCKRFDYSCYHHQCTANSNCFKILLKIYQIRYAYKLNFITNSWCPAAFGDFRKK